MSTRSGGTFTSGAVTILPPDAFFYSLELDDRQVGVASLTVDTLPDGVRVTERMGVDLPIRASTERTQYTIQYTVGNDLRLREYRLTLPGEIPAVQHVTVESDTVLLVYPASGEPRRRLVIRPSLLVPPVLATVYLARQHQLGQGQGMSFATFDPVTLREIMLRMSVGTDTVLEVVDSAAYDSTANRWVPAHADTVQAWAVYLKAGNRQTYLWVDGRGLPIHMGSMGGLTWDRSAFEIVNTNYRREAGRTATGPVIPRGVDPAQGLALTPMDSLRARLRMGSALPWYFPDSVQVPGLTLDHDRRTLHLARVAMGPAVYQLPAPDSVAGPWLKNGPLLAMEDPVLAAVADSLSGGVSSPNELAIRLTAWVAREITWMPDRVTGTAARAVRDRQGNLDEHALVLVALARHAGLPARTVSGLLFAGDRWYFHAWAEVLLDGWVPVDPTLGQAPADARHLRMGVDQLSHPLELLPLAANLPLEATAPVP